jgi:DNA-binding Lrp family transcriptional regulator
MCLYTTKEVSQLIGISERTLYNRLKELRDTKKFIKKSMGYFYTPDEVEKLATKLGVKISLQNSA